MTTAQKVVRAQGMCGELLNGGHDICILEPGHGDHEQQPTKPDVCTDCGSELTHVFPKLSGPSWQYDNTLVMHLSGGYGMFFDDMEDGDKRVFLCHDCAHKACLVLPWLNRLVQPEHSHAHSAEFWEYNNGHLGWDKPAKAT